MLIISFDAVGDDELEIFMSSPQAYPTVNQFIKESAVFRNVPTLFVSNTYPIHTSVATGVSPGTHKIISNTKPRPEQCDEWITNEENIKARTVWQAAREKGIDTAAVLWPVTGRSKYIRWNIPEAHVKPGENQLLTSLKAGSPLLQLRLFLKYKSLFKGTEQPHLDNFSAACMADILRKHKPGLAMVHLTAFDALCHAHGKGSPALNAARASLEKNLKLLLDAAREAGRDKDVLIFSDHSQLNVHTAVVINKYVGTGFVECCGGSAFYHADGASEREVSEAREAIKNAPGFERFLTEEEMEVSGYNHAAFGFAAKAGYCYETHNKEIKATHGYPLNPTGSADMLNYGVFYMARGFGLAPGSYSGGSLLDIAPLILKNLR